MQVDKIGRFDPKRLVLDKTIELVVPNSLFLVPSFAQLLKIFFISFQIWQRKGYGRWLGDGSEVGQVEFNVAQKSDR